MPLIQDQENGGYLEDWAISSLSQGVEIPHLFSYIVQSMIFLTQLPSNEVLQMESARGRQVYDVFALTPKIKK